MRTLRASVLAAVCLAFAAGAPLAARADLAVTVDPNHTSAGFSLSHLTITKVSGSIPIKDVTLKLGDDAMPTSVHVDFDITHITTQNDQRDSDLRSDHFFDVAHDPDMSFESTSITPGKKNSFTMVGNLTMHGVTKPVTLNGTFDGKVTDSHGTHFGYSAGGAIDRTLWNVGTYPPMIVGTSVGLSIQLEAIEK